MKRDSFLYPKCVKKIIWWVFYALYKNIQLFLVYLFTQFMFYVFMYVFTKCICYVLMYIYIIRKNVSPSIYQSHINNKPILQETSHKIQFVSFQNIQSFLEFERLFMYLFDYFLYIHRNDLFIICLRIYLYNAHY